VNLKPKDGFPTLIAAAVFVVVLFICIRLHVHAYVGTLMLLAVGGAYALAGRIARGSPELRREEWTLHATNFGAGQVADVRRGLEQHGYDISVIGVSEALAGLLIAPSAKSMVSFGLLVLLLLARPQGLMGAGRR